MAIMYRDPDTGGMKGAKDVEYGRIPDSLEEVAKHFHDGAEKYPDVAPGVANWSLGYPWSLSIEALNRHLKAWERGEDYITDDDPTHGNNHLAAVCFHALVLLWFQKHGVGIDDRRTLAARARYLEQRSKET